MKRIERCALLAAIVVFTLFFNSCVSLKSKEITEGILPGMQNLGQVSAQFPSFQPVFYKLVERSKLEKAHDILLAEAKEQYKNSVDPSLIRIRNVSLKGHWSGWEAGLIGLTVGVGVVSSALNNWKGTTFPVLLIPVFVNFQKITAAGDVYVPAQR